jgi:hypothetical protein
MLVHLTGGKWGMVIRRILEAAVKTVPLMAVLFVPLIAGIRKLYPWAEDREALMANGLWRISQAYLSPRLFVMRAVFYFVIWAVLAYLLTKWSGEQNTPGEHNYDNRFRNLSGPGLVLWGLTVSFASIDWVMSIDPRWVSTIYGLLFIAGQALSAFCFVVVVETILSRYQPMSDLLKPSYVHDHGKFILAFVMVWAYFGFSQWLIIWAGNLPEEITWYLTRLHGGWQWVGLLLALFHFGVPFVLLLSRDLKRKARTLVKVAVWLLIMRLVDLFWLIAPNFHSQLSVSWLDIVVPVALGGFWLALFFRNLRGQPLLPLYDPHTREFLEPAHE